MILRHLCLSALAALSLAAALPQAAAAADSRLQLRQMDLGIQRWTLERQRIDAYRDYGRANADERAVYRQIKRDERLARHGAPPPTDRVSQRLYQYLPPLGHVGDETAIQADRLERTRLPDQPLLGGTHPAQAYDYISRNTH